jgi:HD-GYP domain-containing protein (c-di-GMP phosphodiesterase class II)
MTPYSRFSVTLGSYLLISTVAVTAVASLLIQQLFIRDTAAITRQAVQVHFQQLFGLDLFGPAPALPAPGAAPAATGYSSGSYGSGSYGSGGHGSHAASASPVPMQGVPGEVPADVPPGSLPAPDALEAAVRLHFDLYDIRHTAFYRPDGTVVFSYRPEEIGTRTANIESILEMAKERTGYAVLDSVAGGRRLPLLHQYLPLSSGDRIVGVVAVYRDIGPLLREIRLIQGLVAACAAGVFLGLFVALRRIYLASTDAVSRQSAALKQALDELHATYDSTLHALSAALESRDRETEGHALRVVAYTARLAQQAGLDRQQLQPLLRGALLHDVGKIGVPDSILNKAGPLTDGEWKEMRRHPLIGAQMLQEIPFLADALPVVRHHHERFDGSGYPHGLKGEAIPLGARIFSVVDTFDAITSDRPYRTARSVSEARAEIMRCAGTQFDPSVVEAFLAVPEQEWRTLAETGAASPAPVLLPHPRTA